MPVLVRVQRAPLTKTARRNTGRKITHEPHQVRDAILLLMDGASIATDVGPMAMRVDATEYDPTRPNDAGFFVYIGGEEFRVTVSKTK